MTLKKYREHQESESDNDIEGGDTALNRSHQSDMLDRTIPQSTQCTIELPNMGSVLLDNGPVVTSHTLHDHEPVDIQSTSEA